MCVAAIGKVEEIKGTVALCNFRGAMKQVSIVLVPKVQIGQFVLVHAGFATEIVQDMQGFYRATVATDAYSRQLLDAIAAKNRELQGPSLRIMNFCGSHEHTIHQFGIRDLLPPNIELISGPGCPVCVTPASEIGLAIELCKQQQVTLTIYGDMLTIPTPWGSLEELRSAGADIRLVHDINQSLELARQDNKQVVHYAVGFETTAPSTGAAILAAEELDNFSVISSHRLTLPAMEYVLSDSAVDAVLCPGNVAAITGYEPFEQVYANHKLPLMITGFEPIDVLEALLKVLDQLTQQTSAVANQYSRVVRPEGNPKALEILAEVFTTENATWRGLPVLPNSRLVLRDKYVQFNAEVKFGLRQAQIALSQSKIAMSQANNQSDVGVSDSCRCGDILRGAKQPADCPAFGRACTPDTPQGPCMISAEGACRIRYAGHLW